MRSLKFYGLVFLVCSLQGTVALGKEKISRTGRIELAGSIPDRCSIQVNGMSQHTLRFATVDGETSGPQSVTVTSFCNRAARHAIIVSYEADAQGRGVLRDDKNPKGAKSLPFLCYLNDGTAVKSQSSLPSYGMENKLDLQIHVESVANTPPGSYKGTVLFSIAGA